MKVIFLDFDGVIVISPEWRKANSACIHYLNRITEATGAKIVVSSTWRLLDDWEQTLKSWGVTGEIVGCTTTKFLSNDRICRSRSLEISDWLNDRQDVTDFIVLDDEITIFNPNKQVGTNFMWGLTASDMARAISLLGGK